MTQLKKYLSKGLYGFNNMSIDKIALTTLVFICCFLSIQAQVATTVTWPGTANAVGVVAPVNAAFTPLNITKGSDLNNAATFTIDGYGTSGSNPQFAWTEASLANAVTFNAYVEYGLTLSCATNFSITTISFTTRTSAGTLNVLSDVRYSTDNFATFSSLGAIPNAVNTTATVQSITPASSIDMDPGQTLKIRIYGYGLAAKADKLYLLNFTLAGTANALTPCAGPMSGTLNVGIGQTYTSLTSACGLFAAINACGLSGNLIVNITSNTSETGANALNQWAGAWTLTIQPDAATNRTLSGDVAAFLIHLNGADNVNIDGRFPAGTGTAKYLTFRNENTAFSLFLLDLTASNNTLQYINCASGFNGIAIDILASSNNTISHCDIFDWAQDGILVIAGTNTTIEYNNIYQSFAKSAALRGIDVDNAPGAIVRKNHIHDLLTTAGPTMGILSLGGAGAQTISIQNNMIDMSLTRAAVNIYGIYLQPTNNTNNQDVFFNSIYLAGGGTSSTACLYKGSATGTLNIKNNILFNACTSTSFRQRCIAFNAAAGIVATTLNMDNNDYYNTTGALGDIGLWNATSCATIATWRTNSGKDAATFNADPKFVAPTDLHIQPGFFQTGIAAGGITTDIDDQTRSAPSIGCDEECSVGGGSAYAVYAVDGSANVVDCEFTSSAATSTTCGGVACKVCTPADDAYANVNITTYPIITAENIQCLNSDIDFTSATPVPNWTGFGANPLIAPPSNANPLNNQQYTATLGRRTISATGASTSQTYLLQEDFETGSPGWTQLSQNGSGNWATLNNPAYAYSGSNSKYCLYKKLKNSDAFLFFPAIAATIGTTYYIRYYQRVAMSVFPESMALTVGTAATIAAQTTTLSTLTNLTNETYVLRTASFTALATTNYYFAFHATSVKNMDAIIVDSVSVFTSAITAPTVNYTDFLNITMAAPSSGTILGVSPLCSGISGSYSSSTAGTPGFTYAWAITDPAGGTHSPASPTGGSTGITFTNSTGSPITFTVNVTVSSECCGPLSPAPTQYLVVINPPPVAPTASATPSPICPGAISTLNATAPAACSFQWYNAAVAGTLLSSNASYAVTPAVTTSYYVQATTVAGCPGPRTTVTVTVTPTTAPVTVNGSSCGAGNITVSISAPVAGYIYNWYTGSCGGVLVQSSTATSYTAFTAATTTYYVNAVASGGCAASTCQTATATIGSPANPLVWLGAVGGLNNWFNTANWTGGCLPTCTDNVLIPAPTGNNPDIGFNPAGPAACKDITLGSSGAPTLSFSDSKAELDVCGNFTHTTTLTSNNLGRVVFMGTTAQTYTRTGTGSFNDVTLNNTAGTATLTIGGANDMVLGTAGTFTFQSGKVITNANKLIINNINTASMGGYAAGRYVEGNLRRYLNTAATGTYDFPVGIANNGITTNCYELAKINFTQAPATITYLTAYFNGWGGSIPGALGSSECLTTYNNVALDNGYWQIDAPASTNNNGMYDMTLYNTGYSNSAAGWTVMSMHSPSVTWGLLNGDGSSSTCVVSPVTAVLRKNMKGFSKFATAQSTTPLPIELLTFEAAYNGKTVDVKWITASEVNNNYFTVERSTNAIDFSSIGTVPSKAINGNSTSPLDYYLNDADVESGVYYYRLKQTDFNGTYQYSNIVSVTIDDDAIFIIKPNPTTTTSDVIYTCFDSENATLKVFDYRGRLVISKDLLCTKGQNISTIDLSDQPDGVFFVTLTTNEKVYKTKLLKSK